ncbi:hypothetical protein JCM19232_4341 [Vibrio ishigakensis]|uniref:Uncharacterized protein n=1 Tax=Vibrio ishigakensis TaxID=1481914 RepID=A0A0B8PPM5_9VIBR|nr:hypothetical protein JCM19232_4341 [Vibrio ishigakensis]
MQANKYSLPKQEPFLGKEESEAVWSGLVTNLHLLWWKVRRLEARI